MLMGCSGAGVAVYGYGEGARGKGDGGVYERALGRWLGEVLM